jgi:hypothetical protein
MDEHRITYTTAAGVWRRGGVVEVMSIKDTLIASFPLDFIIDGGDNTWRYVCQAVALLIEVEPGHEGLLVDNDDTAVNVDDPPTAGIYRYIEHGQEWFRPSGRTDKARQRLRRYIRSRA